MNRAMLVALGTGTFITSAAAIGINAARDAAVPRTLSRGEYQLAIASIEGARPRALARCETLAGAEREFCQARASADEMVRVADLEQRFRGTRQAARDALRARVEARYQLARAGCAAVKGYPHDQCLIAAHAARGRALLELQEPYAVRPD